MITLYQMPISHYCEKVRWVLDYKRLPHKKKNLLPGLHVKPMLKLTEQSSLPVLVDDKKTVFNSADIISYLDSEYPRFPLNSGGPDIAESDLEKINDWEKLADNVIGVNVRKICYSVLLDHPEIVIPFFTQDGPWYGRFLMKRIFPKLRSRMKKFMKINPEELSLSLNELELVKEKVLDRIKDHEYLVGKRFSRADLSVAALFAPFFGPEKYGLEWPESYPEPLQGVIHEYVEIGSWVKAIYKKHR